MLIVRIVLVYTLALFSVAAYAARHTQSPPVYKGKVKLENSGSGAPSDAACDSADEKGDFYQDDANNRLYVCFDSGWRRFNSSPG